MSFAILKKKNRRPFCSAVIVAAGSSVRMGRDKLMLELGGIPVLVRTMMAFDACECIDEILIVSQPENLMTVAELCRSYGIEKATKILSGGMTRPESALVGVCEISPDAKLVAIHDAARPLITDEVICAAVEEAARYNAAAPAVAVKDTVKLVDDNIVETTPDRADTRAVQTPQVFNPDIIKAALTYVIQQGIEVTDDCSAAELLGVPVRLTEGSEENIKITTELDVLVAETILEKRGEGL